MCVALPQGDPISLMVIAIAVEALMVLVARALGDEVLSSFQSVLAMQQLSIYADDVVCSPRPLVLDHWFIKQALQIFGEAFGLQVNYCASQWRS